MTPLQKVYDGFLAKINDDEWDDWLIEDMTRDLRSILDSAIVWFKFPKGSLDIDEENEAFVDTLSPKEIQIIATRMKVEWLNREILTWERIKPLYVERDFSEANMLNKLYQALDAEKKTAEKLESSYYRSRNHKPFDFSKLAGKNNG